MASLEQTGGRPAGVARLRDPTVPLVALDLASVTSYLYVGQLAGLAPEHAGALWCPLVSEPTELDLDLDRARQVAERLRVPLNLPKRHPAPVLRMMRLAALACARGCGTSFFARMANLAYASSVDLEVLGRDAKRRQVDLDYLETYDLQVDRGKPVTTRETRLAGERGSESDKALGLIAGELGALGVSGAPALRWGGELYVGIDAIERVLSLQPSVPYIDVYSTPSP
jgi:hypothetical protein